MKLTMLGTGNASAMECYNTCYIFSNEGQHFLVDTGGGNQILKRLSDVQIPLEEIHDIFLTQEHLEYVLECFWLMLKIGNLMNQGAYVGALNIYCSSPLIEKLCAALELMLPPDIMVHIGKDILFVAVEHGDQLKLLDSDVTFFDIGSGERGKLGFTLVMRDGIKIACCGDEPYHEENEEFIRESDWLLHEAYCMQEEAERYKAESWNHSTVKEACEIAERLGIANLILYHMEDMHMRDRKEIYSREGMQCYSGKLHIPDDLECFEIARSLRFPGALH